MYGIFDPPGRREAGYCSQPFQIVVNDRLSFPIKGAEFTFFDERGKVKHKSYSNASGIAVVNLARDAYYTLVQTASGYGYQADRRIHRLKVTKDCRFIVDGRAVGYLRIVNSGSRRECVNCRD